MKASWPACFTVDCDALEEHHAVWGLPEPDRVRAERFWMQGVLAALEFLRRQEVQATFFIVGSRVPSSGMQLLRKMATVHEIGNHTWSHPWDLSRMDEPGVEDEISRNQAFLQEKLGVPVRGFRAPGYHLPATAVPVLERQGYGYSSSQLTGWVYPLAKAAVSGWMRLRGQQSRTVRHPWSDALTPRVPYHPDARCPSRPGTAPFWEIPVAASAWGLPATGPLVHAAPGDFWFATPRTRPWILNFHLTDFIEERDFPELARNDPMLRVPRARRLRRLELLIERARRQERAFCTMLQLCNRLQSES